MLLKFKKILRKNKIAKSIVKEIRDTITFDPNIYEITPINCRKIDCNDKRINILIPSLNKKDIFGGISTALKFYEEICLKHSDYKRRIIITEAFIEDIDDKYKEKYRVVTSEYNGTEDYQILPFNDRVNKTIPVYKNDIFIATAWWTAYNAKSIIDFQYENYNKLNKLIYLIQDFEPGFYPWSSRYSLADSTYNMNIPVTAVFNTKLLMDFFEKNDYKFNEIHYFEPCLNDSLKSKLLNLEESKDRKKQILIYGRPSVARNAFEIIVATLRLWVSKQHDSKEWKIYSIGEKHCDVDLGNNIILKSLGKLTLDEYAELMLESYLGISLMISPHPSYPPLEMSTFGMKVITNSFSNKNLSDFNKNIISLDNLNTNDICDIMIKICDNYSKEPIKIEVNKDYVYGENTFNFIDSLSL